MPRVTAQPRPAAAHAPSPAYLPQLDGVRAIAVGAVLVAPLLRGAAPALKFPVAFAIATATAAVSWRLVERPINGLKRRFEYASQTP